MSHPRHLAWGLSLLLHLGLAAPLLHLPDAGPVRTPSADPHAAWRLLTNTQTQASPATTTAPVAASAAPTEPTQTVTERAAPTPTAPPRRAAPTPTPVRTPPPPGPRAPSPPAPDLTGAPPVATPAPPVPTAAAELVRATHASQRDAYLHGLRAALATQRRYPALARRLALEGVVRIGFLLAADGRLQQIRLVHGSGERLLDEAALAAAEALGRYRPIPPGLRAAPWSLEVELHFSLGDT